VKKYLTNFRKFPDSQPYSCSDCCLLPYELCHFLSSFFNSTRHTHTPVTFDICTNNTDPHSTKSSSTKSTHIRMRTFPEIRTRSADHFDSCSHFHKLVAQTDGRYKCFSVVKDDKPNCSKCDEFHVVMIMTESDFHSSFCTAICPSSAHKATSSFSALTQFFLLSSCSFSAGFDTVGWVIWPVKTRPHMTYNVLVGRQSTQS